MGQVWSYGLNGWGTKKLVVGGLECEFVVFWGKFGEFWGTVLCGFEGVAEVSSGGW